MPYEDPIEAALRALTDVEWRKRDHTFETRTNKTHMLGIQEMLADHHIAVQAEVSAARSGRYIITVDILDTPKILKAIDATKTKVKPKRRKSHTGFTLVELAIVLVIIGLIVGGVLVGQDLIHAAQIRSVVTDIEKYNAAADTFQEKYTGLPGDLLNTKAVQFGFNIAANDAGRDGFPGRGNGDRKIADCADTRANYGCENALFWADLGLAGLISFNSIATSTTADNLVPGEVIKSQIAEARLLPVTKLRSLVQFVVFNDDSRNRFSINAFRVKTNELKIDGSGLSPLEAGGIDRKLDDGEPLSGSISATVGDLITPETSGTDCIADNHYNTASADMTNKISCALSVLSSF